MSQLTNTASRSDSEGLVSVGIPQGLVLGAEASWVELLRIWVNHGIIVESVRWNGNYVLLLHDVVVPGDFVVFTATTIKPDGRRVFP